MTKILLPSLAAASVLIGAGCERHAASQTVPGYSEKEARIQEIQEKMARTPIAINPDAPKFFPPKNEP